MSFCLLFGGVSWEHEISIVSAITLKDILKQKIQYFIFVDREHRFYLIEPQEMQVDFFSQEKYKSKKELQIDSRGFYHYSFISKKYLKFNTLINLIHGGDGEDGTLAGLFDFYHIPYIGPRIEASVLSYNKLYTKLFAQTREINILPFEVLTQSQERTTCFSFPIIIKPSRLGSSIGISIAKDLKSFHFGLDKAFEYDSSVILEPFFSGIKEYNLAGCKIEDTFVFSAIEEPKKEDFLNFENKYLDFSRQSKIQNPMLDDELTKKLQNAFIKIYNHCFEGAIIRCDFFMHQNIIYLNEINPIPGSMANYLFEDFTSTLELLSSNLPKNKPIFIDYQYIKKIQKAK